MSSDLEDIREAFGFFDSWEDKYRFVLDLGRNLEPLPETDKSEANLIRGCQSQVWITSSVDEVSGDLHFLLDSDAHIVRGLIAIVLAAYQGKPAEQIVSFDIDGLFEELALMQHLSPTRGNGLRAMVAKIRETAARQLAA